MASADARRGKHFIGGQCRSTVDAEPSEPFTGHSGTEQYRSVMRYLLIPLIIALLAMMAALFLAIPPQASPALRLAGNSILSL